MENLPDPSWLNGPNSRSDDAWERFYEDNEAEVREEVELEWREENGTEELDGSIKPFEGPIPHKGDVEIDERTLAILEKRFEDYQTSGPEHDD